MNHKPIVLKSGKELPVADLKGKPYLQVGYRLVWFREEHPEWSIDTILVQLQPDFALVEARILNEEGRLIACDRKLVTKSSFQAFVEKATTGAIGRALALCGYGTQFEPEFDEEGIDISDAADSPIEPPKKSPPPLSQAPKIVIKPKVISHPADEYGSGEKAKPVMSGFDDFGEPPEWVK